MHSKLTLAEVMLQTASCGLHQAGWGVTGAAEKLRIRRQISRLISVQALPSTAQSRCQHSLACERTCHPGSRSSSGSYGRAHNTQCPASSAKASQQSQVTAAGGMPATRVVCVQGPCVTGCACRASAAYLKLQSFLFKTPIGENSAVTPTKGTPTDLWRLCDSAMIV